MHLDWVFLKPGFNSSIHVEYHNYHSSCMSILLSYSTTNTTHNERDQLGVAKRETDNCTQSGSEWKAKKTIILFIA